MTTAVTTSRAAADRARRQGGALVLGLAGMAWVAVLLWDASPYARFLDHDALAGSQLGPAVTTGVFVAGWVLMLAAMMFPTTLALVRTFTPVARRRGGPGELVGMLLVGYVAVWTVVGLAAFAADLGVHAVVDRWHWLEANPWTLAAVGLAGAGAYQFSTLKQRCLTVCRSPRMFVFSRWKGRSPRLESFTLGVDHGRYCIGCCVGLMVVAFGVGMGNLAWMFVLGGVMATEKLAPRGDRLVAPLGLGLLAAAAAIVAFH